jgi:hypothetical protein
MKPVPSGAKYDKTNKPFKVGSIVMPNHRLQQRHALSAGRHQFGQCH